MSIDAMIEQTIQVRDRVNQWQDLTRPSFDAPLSKYRIKPEPKTIYVNEYTAGSIVAYHCREDACRVSPLGLARTAVPYREVVED